MSSFHANRTLIVLKLGDITEEDSDAIVNAANSHLAHGGGVAGAIVRKGGEIIQRESDQLAPVQVGSAVITTGGRLIAKHVIHAVGPRMGEGNEDEKLRSATQSALRLADEKGLRTISFPAISTGIFGYPVERCSTVMLTAVRQYCEENTGLQQISFCLFDGAALQTFQQAAEKTFSS